MKFPAERLTAVSNPSSVKSSMPNKAFWPPGQLRTYCSNITANPNVEQPQILHLQLQHDLAAEDYVRPQPFREFQSC